MDNFSSYMGKNKRKKVQRDIQVVGRQQDNEVRNILHMPSSEDTIALKSPAIQGEESVSGDAPDPESDDDTLEDAHAVGEQLGEDIEHPKPVDIARDINEAEKEIKKE